MNRKTIAIATAVGAGSSGTYYTYLAADPDTEVVLWDGRDFDQPGVLDDRPCEACDFENGEICSCPVPGTPPSEHVVCGCYFPIGGLPVDPVPVDEGPPDPGPTAL